MQKNQREKYEKLKKTSAVMIVQWAAATYKNLCIQIQYFPYKDHHFILMLKLYGG